MAHTVINVANVNLVEDAVQSVEERLEELSEQIDLLMSVNEINAEKIHDLEKALAASKQETEDLREHLNDVMKWAFAKIQGGGRDEHQYLVNKPEFDEWLSDYDIVVVRE